MIVGHGDDLWRFGRPIVANFSSNVYGGVDLTALKEHLAASLEAISHYPEPEPYTLERALATLHGIEPGCVCVTNGATEAIYLIAQAWRGSMSFILQPTFSEYADACRLHCHCVRPIGSARGDNGGPQCVNAAPHCVNGDALCVKGDALGVNVDPKCAMEGPRGAMEDIQCIMRDPRGENGDPHCVNGNSHGAMGDLPCVNGDSQCIIGDPQGDINVIPTEAVGPSGGISLFWLCNPNNPDGRVIPKEQLLTQIANNPDTIFVIDQSYGFFTEEPLLTPAEAIAAGNVLQLHSMTKRYAMPGLRLGYITGSQALIDRIREVRMPWSVNALAIEAGLFLASHPSTAPIDKQALLKEAQRLRDELNAIPGLSVEPTKTHFMLCHLDTGTAASLKRYLAENHSLLIRDASNFEGLDAGHFRIAAQTREENDMLVKAIKDYILR